MRMQGTSDAGSFWLNMNEEKNLDFWNTCKISHFLKHCESNSWPCMRFPVTIIRWVAPRRAHVPINGSQCVRMVTIASLSISSRLRIVGPFLLQLEIMSLSSLRSLRDFDLPPIPIILEQQARKVSPPPWDCRVTTTKNPRAAFWVEDTVERHTWCWASWWPQQKAKHNQLCVLIGQEGDTSPTPSFDWPSGWIHACSVLLLCFYWFYHLTLCVSLKLLQIHCGKRNVLNNPSHPLGNRGSQVHSSDSSWTTAEGPCRVAKCSLADARTGIPWRAAGFWNMEENLSYLVYVVH